MLVAKINEHHVMQADKKIIIVGAGIAGLTAALELEKNGFAPTIIEATDRVGGRVKTDYEDGFQFDHGFQVMLTAYPEIKHYFDFDALNLSYFKPGAIIFRGKKKFRLVDPLRQPGAAFAAIFSPAGTFLDKLKIWQLSVRLKRKTIDEIFNEPSTTTLSYLKSLGFSDQIISNFFRPFFSGIFLEKDLTTSSRLFQFIFKMFTEGYAAIPENGMQAIPDQLLVKLEKTEMLYGTRIESIGENEVMTSSGNHPFDALIIATEPSKILTDYQTPKVQFKSTVNLYFSVPSQKHGGFIGLLPTDETIVNNIAILSDVVPQYAPTNRSLLSVSVVGKPAMPDSKLQEQVRDELARVLKIDKNDIDHLKSYDIGMALPIVDEPSIQLTDEQIRHQKNIYFAGDHLLGGSLNGAMVSGRQSVELLISDINDS